MIFKMIVTTMNIMMRLHLILTVLLAPSKPLQLTSILRVTRNPTSPKSAWHQINSSVSMKTSVPFGIDLTIRRNPSFLGILHLICPVELHHPKHFPVSLLSSHPSTAKPITMTYRHMISHLPICMMSFLP
jgi:hypothetical protein